MSGEQQKPRCRDCNDELTDDEIRHGREGPRGDGYGHAGLCCQCFNVSCERPPS